VRTADRRAVVEALEDVAQGTDARFLVAPARDGWVAVLPSTSAQVMDPGEAIAQRLPAVGDVLRTMVHDDDVLWYCYWRRGEAVDQYCSWPEYFDIASDEERRSVAGQPERMAEYQERIQEQFTDVFEAGPASKTSVNCSWMRSWYSAIRSG